MAETRIGISGWTYAPWRGVFYPEDLAHKRELEYASRKFNSIEINGSFYSLQRPSSYKAWYEATPADFVFSVKGGRFITHMKKLKDVDVATANFFASGILALKEKLGPILWQFPPMMRFAEMSISLMDLYKKASDPNDASYNPTGAKTFLDGCAAAAKLGLDKRAQKEMPPEYD